MFSPLRLVIYLCGITFSDHQNEQFLSDMPKLLFVGIMERTCRTTVIREIPGISDCFQSKEEKNGQEPEIKVSKGQ